MDKFIFTQTNLCNKIKYGSSFLENKNEEEF